MAIPEHVVRMQAERSDLGGRLDRLAAFLETEKFSELPAADQGLLRAQASAMQTYLSILTKRIERQTQT